MNERINQSITSITSSNQATKSLNQINQIKSNQSINQSAKPINQSINQSINHPITSLLITSHHNHNHNHNPISLLPARGVLPPIRAILSVPVQTGPRRPHPPQTQSRSHPDSIAPTWTESEAASSHKHIIIMSKDKQTQSKHKTI
jgi:hypothetical protein